MKTNKIKIAICSLLVCACVFGMLMLFINGMEVFSEKLEEINPKKTGDMDTALWVIKHIMYFLPIAITAILQGICGKIKPATLHIRHREKYIESIIAFVFLLLVIAPTCVALSGALGEGEEITSLPIEWLMWQILLFLPVTLYQKIRADELQKTSENPCEEGNRD